MNTWFYARNSNGFGHFHLFFYGIQQEKSEIVFLIAPLCITNLLSAAEQYNKFYLARQTNKRWGK